MEVDRTYDDFFTSLLFAIITCTVLVSITKFLTVYYFIFTFLLVVIILLVAAGYDFLTYETEMKKVIEKRKEKYDIVMDGVDFKKKSLAKDSFRRSFRRTKTINRLHSSDKSVFKEIGSSGAQNRKKTKKNEKLQRHATFSYTNTCEKNLRKLAFVNSFRRPKTTSLATRPMTSYGTRVGSNESLSA